MVHGRGWYKGCTHGGCRVGPHLGHPLLRSMTLSSLDLLDLSVVETHTPVASDPWPLSGSARLSLWQCHSPLGVEWVRGCDPLKEICELRLSPPCLCSCICL